MPKIENLVAAVLDTHVWVWTCAGDSRSSAMKAFKGTPIISAISVWEVAMLENNGRLKLYPDLEQWVISNLGTPVVLEPLSPAISIESCRLPDFHGDSADRMIVATAIVLGVPLISADREILAWNNQHQRLQILTLG